MSATRQMQLHTLYSEHNGWLQGWLRKKLGCPHNAADLSHDTFARLLGLPELPSLREPRAYLLVTAGHLLINRGKRQRLEQDVLRTLAILAEDRGMQSPEHIVEMQQLLATVMLALTRELDEKPRQAFLMARLENLSYADIASRLQVSESSVKQYLAKALAHCHARLSEAAGA